MGYTRRSVLSASNNYLCTLRTAETVPAIRRTAGGWGGREVEGTRVWVEEWITGRGAGSVEGLVG